MQDVVVEDRSPEQITVLATRAIAKGQQLLLLGDQDDGRRSAAIVRAFDCAAVMVEGERRHRVRLQIVGSIGDCA